MGKHIIDNVLCNLKFVPFEHDCDGIPFEGNILNKPSIKISFKDKLIAIYNILRGRLIPLYFVADLSDKEKTSFIKDETTY
ncbi:MAG: hypothetical protein ACRDD8_09760 [Bacteroidales bacterium]